MSNETPDMTRDSSAAVHGGGTGAGVGDMIVRGSLEARKQRQRGDWTELINQKAFIVRSPRRCTTTADLGNHVVAQGKWL